MSKKKATEPRRKAKAAATDAETKAKPEPKAHGQKVPAKATSRATRKASAKPAVKARAENAPQVASSKVDTSVLNESQRKAVEHGRSPLLIIAGAGTGKTLTLAHRTARLIMDGVPPDRILLLTFTRRSAESLLQRVAKICHESMSNDVEERANASARTKVWGGTFHATGARLLRSQGARIGIDPRFTIHDQSDSEALLEVLRTELRVAEVRKDFPKKGTCQSLHSGWINSGLKLDAFVNASFPWCKPHLDGLRTLFEAYHERKRSQNVFDFDDLLLYWNRLLADPVAGPLIRKRFDCVLVDEYQDTNPIQSQILRQLCPDGQGLTVVGDDAQSIYSFRGATVRNILDFPKQFPGAAVVRLEDNYRSTSPILDATNSIIRQVSEGFEKELRASREGGQAPQLLACSDEYAEARAVVDRIERHQKDGVPLREQAVLFRASHHSLAVEMELARRRIPFHKYGGLKFADAAHVKDLVAFLRLAENPMDLVSGMRLFKLLPGIGQKKAQVIMEEVIAAGGNLECLARSRVPAATTSSWAAFRSLLGTLTRTPSPSVTDQIDHVLKFLAPLVREHYEDPEQRIEDLKKLRGLGERYEDRSAFLAELTLDPPSSTRDLAAAGALEGDKDALVLSTIHSAKGLEWEAVTVINATDGGIPSSRSMESAAQLDEELRLFYVALTRARTWLTVTYPRYRSSPQASWGSFDQPILTRFLPASIRRLFESRNA
jgi:DNA helicase II / ATP-dependent DNA helicase PcrA